MIRLNHTHSFLSKSFQIYPLSFSKNSSELSRIRSIHPHTPRMTQNSHQLLTHLHYVSGTCPGRELSEIPVNNANSVQFARIVHELREIRTIY